METPSTGFIPLCALAVMAASRAPMASRGVLAATIPGMDGWQVAL